MKNPKLKVVYDDPYFYVIDKPFGVAVNRSQTTRSYETIQDLISDDFQKIIDQKPKIEVDHEQKIDSQIDEDIIEENLRRDAFYTRFGIVHRIDKDTSGLLIIAKDPDTFLLLQKLFADRMIKKEYTALVYGNFTDLAIGESFEIDAPIARSNKNHEKYAVDADGKTATTIFKIDSILQDMLTKEIYTLLTCYPQTGRTHQIRVHLTVLGHPIFGDKLYSGKKRYKSHNQVLDRQFLHATTLQFIHPITNQDIRINSDIPSDLLTVLNSLHKL